MHRCQSSKRPLISTLSCQVEAGELLAAAARDEPRATHPDSSSGPATDAIGARSPVRLSLLGELLSFPPERQPLDEDHFIDGLQRLASMVGQADGDGSESAASAAAAALTTVAGELNKRPAAVRLSTWCLIGRAPC